MIPIYPKKCKKSNKCKKKVVDLGCTRRFHFFKVLKAQKKNHFRSLTFCLRLLEMLIQASQGASSSGKQHTLLLMSGDPGMSEHHRWAHGGLSGLGCCWAHPRWAVGAHLGALETVGRAGMPMYSLFPKTAIPTRLGPLRVARSRS